MFRFMTIIVSVLLLASCISYHRDGADEYQRPAGLQIGVTSADWIYENLGNPHGRHVRKNGSEILHYTFDRSEETKVNILLIVNVHNKDKNTSHLYIELENGVVTDFWDD